MGLCLIAALGCNQDAVTPASSTEFDSAPHVEKMQGRCPDTGDADGSFDISGRYELSDMQVSWFRLPRNENLIEQHFEWEKDTIPVRGPLTLKASNGKLQGSLTLLKEQNLSGSLYKDGRFCLFGPAELAMKDAETTATLFVEGKVELPADNSVREAISRLQLTVNLGVTAQAQGKKYNITSVVQAAGLRQDPRVYSAAADAEGWWVELHGEEYFCWQHRRQLVCDVDDSEQPIPMQQLVTRLKAAVTP